MYVYSTKPITLLYLMISPCCKFMLTVNGLVQTRSSSFASGQLWFYSSQSLLTPFKTVTDTVTEKGNFSVYTSSLVYLPLKKFVTFREINLELLHEK